MNREQLDILSQLYGAWLDASDAVAHARAVYWHERTREDGDWAAVSAAYQAMHQAIYNERLARDNYVDTAESFDQPDDDNAGGFDDLSPEQQDIWLREH